MVHHARAHESYLVCDGHIMLYPTDKPFHTGAFWHRDHIAYIMLFQRTDHVCGGKRCIGIHRVDADVLFGSHQKIPYNIAIVLTLLSRSHRQRELGILADY